MLLFRTQHCPLGGEGRRKWRHRSALLTFGRSDDLLPYGEDVIDVSNPGNVAKTSCWTGRQVSYRDVWEVTEMARHSYVPIARPENISKQIMINDQGLRDYLCQRGWNNILDRRLYFVGEDCFIIDTDYLFLCENNFLFAGGGLKIKKKVCPLTPLFFKIINLQFWKRK